MPIRFRFAFEPACYTISLCETRARSDGRGALVVRRRMRPYNRIGSKASLAWPTAIVALIILAWLISLMSGGRHVGGAVTVTTGKTAKLANAAGNEVISFFELFRFRSHVRRARQLEAEVGLLKTELQQAAAYKKENEELRRLLRLDLPSSFNAIGAEVATRSMDLWFDALILDRGSEAGIGLQHLVVCARGLVGEVVEAGYGYSKVRLLTSPDFAISAVTNTSNVSGIALGSGLTRLNLQYVPVESTLHLQEKVFTAGLAVQADGKPRPRGLLLGYVESIKKNPGQSTLQIVIKPAVDISNIGAVAVLSPK